jgi:hypothetical protein
MDKLNQLAERLVNKFLPIATRNQSFFVNEISRDISVDNNNESLDSVISGLLAAVVRNAKDTCIRLTAKKNGSLVTFEIKESGCISSYAMACGLQDVQTMAEKIGGNLSISIQKTGSTIVAFTFPIIPAVTSAL